MLLPYTDFQFILAYLRHNPILGFMPKTEIEVDVQKYTITFRTFNYKKQKEFGLTIRLLSVEEQTNSQIWHCHEWISRRNRFESRTKFLSERLFWLPDFLIQRQKHSLFYLRNSFQIHPKMSLKDYLPMYSNCPSDISRYFWMRRTLKMYTLPEIAILFAEMDLPIYISTHIIHYLHDHYKSFIYVSDARLLLLFQLARGILITRRWLRVVHPPTAKDMRLVLVKRWDRARI